MTDSAIDAAATSRFRTLWERVRGRSGNNGRDACGEPWMLGFGVAGAELAAPPPAAAPPETVERPEVHDPQRSRVLVGRDADDHGARRPEPEAFLDEPEPVTGQLDASGAPLDRDHELVEALHRVADSFERVADSLDADRRERRSTLGDVDSLLRALVGELRSPASVAPVVLAGTIDAAEAAEAAAEAEAAEPGRSLPIGEGAIDLTAVDTESDRRPFERARRR